MQVSNQLITDLIWNGIDLDRDMVRCERDVSQDGRYVTIERQDYIQLIHSVIKMSGTIKSITEQTKEST